MWVVVFSSGRESLGNWLNGGELLCESSRERRDTEGNLFKVGRDILCGTKAGRRGLEAVKGILLKWKENYCVTV